MKGVIKTVTLLGIASLSFISCSSVRGYTSTAVEPGGVLIELPTLAEVSVSADRVEQSHSKVGKSLTRREIEDNVIADALSKVQADVLLEPRYTTTEKGGRIESISVSGYPAKYIDFRPLECGDTALLNLESPGHRYMILQNPMRTYAMSSLVSSIESASKSASHSLALTPQQLDSQQINGAMGDMFTRAVKQRNAGIAMFSTGAVFTIVFYGLCAVDSYSSMFVAGLTLGSLGAATMIAGIPLWVSGANKMKKDGAATTLLTPTKSLKMGVGNDGKVALQFAF